MKSLLAIAALAIAAVSAEESGCGPFFNNQCNRDEVVQCGTPSLNRRICDDPCALTPFTGCGLGACECPAKCNALWISSCTIGAECRSYEKDCRVKCDEGDYNGRKVFGVCVGFSRYKRPFCAVGLQACKIEKKHGHPVFGQTVLKNGHFECIREEPSLLLPNQYEVCPEGYYPTCFVIEDLDHDRKH